MIITKEEQNERNRQRRRLQEQQTAAYEELVLPLPHKYKILCKCSVCKKSLKQEAIEKETLYYMK